MQDFLKKYRKNKLLSNIGIVATSLIMAFGINFLLIDGTVTGQNLKASILNANNVEINSDIYFDIIDEKIVLKTSKQINNVKNLTLSIIYNPENVSILNITSLNNKFAEIGNEKGIKTLILNFENAYNINSNDNIIELTTSKKIKKSENLNIINANFTDNNGKNYLLSTSGITF